MSATLDKIKEEVKTLAPEELQQVRELVDSLLDEQSGPPLSEDQVEQQLAAKGIISLPSGPPVGAAARPRPVQVTGKPVSETIIEERR